MTARHAAEGSTQAPDTSRLSGISVYCLLLPVISSGEAGAEQVFATATLHKQLGT